MFNTNKKVVKSDIRGQSIQRLLNSSFLVYIILVVMLIIAQMIIPGFLGLQNIGSILKIASFVGIAAIGQTLCIILAGIDMSIGNTITIANIIAAQLMFGNNENILIAVFGVTIIGIIVGVINATGITYFNIPPMIMTLGTGTVVQGVALLYSKGAPKGSSAPFIRYLVNDTVIFGAISWVVILWAILAAITIITMKYTTAGRKLYTVGSNPVVARYSGISSTKTKYVAYIISGITAGFTGLLLAGYTGTASAEAGVPYSMSTIVAVVVGGTAMTGGTGGYVGTIAGAIIMTVLENILTVVNIPESGRIFSQGIIILIMALIYGKEKKKY